VVSHLRLSGSRLLGLAVAVLVLVPVASAAACAGADSRPSAGARYSEAVRCLLNAERASAGLGPLASDRRLARAARRFASAMVRQGFFDHVSPQGSTMNQRIRAAGYPGRRLGETIAWGTGSLATPAAIVEGWMHSPPHRAIIMDGRFHDVGLGIVAGSPSGGGQAATVTADFGG
jgi:uncharacterized protein YkwD